MLNVNTKISEFDEFAVGTEADEIESENADIEMKGR